MLTKPGSTQLISPRDMTISKKISQSLLKLPQLDHRHIGVNQKLFFFSELSQGSCFFQPRGAHIYNKLIEYLKNEYKQRGYQEVITPNIYHCKLWETSGHWDYYKDNMIRFDLGGKEFSLKPMNCPAHCLMFKHQATLTSDQLPVRWADFGALHRNENSGSLLGLSRVRRFQQDDAHIFCTPQQVEREVAGCLDFAKHVYGKFGFHFHLELSLRPEKYLGDPAIWDNAEESLRVALDKSDISWSEHQFEGAFYGPKIDLIVKDSTQKSHQCATIQLDFQLPDRFELEYKDLHEGVRARPVIIHRAILGSIERFIAMIAENCQGRWPFWLSPLQAQVIPVHMRLNGYAQEVCDSFRELGFWVDCDTDSSTRLDGKIREAFLMRYNLMLIVGQKEADSRSVTVRVMTPQKLDETGSEGAVKNLNIPLDELMARFKEFELRQVDRADLELLSERQ